MSDGAAGLKPPHCIRCETDMVSAEQTLRYLGHDFKTPLYTCPVCGQVYIPKALAEGKMAEVERLMEEK